MIERLMELVPPPKLPIHVGTMDGWRLVENELGVEIPIDYKILISHYGSGAFDGFLWLLNPFEPNKNLNFQSQGAYLRRSFAELRSQSPDFYGSPIFPEPKGLLPWATTDEPDMIGWIVEGGSQQWAVGFHDISENKVINFKCNVTDFLIKVLSNEFVGLNFFPDDFPQSCPTFVQP
ncbi:SMI1/KNR4 family protein [Phyllobacterium endophyticum]|uniref:SMI1/KNR4 family protein n=1 Tax=Phyllobacterium endophyticum TaxID=1149773 RepID=UPI0011CC9114|nr:SMI1/KNR4 family protein [Phyllobacterium endophyticum]TXR48434.1 SMI1/KNR4 family protein [Phyllobacterium endophyticum]